MRTLGIVLIVAGIAALVYTGFTFKTKKEVADIGPIEINKEKKHSVSWPPITGAIMLIGGIALLIVGRKER